MEALNERVIQSVVSRLDQRCPKCFPRVTPSSMYIVGRAEPWQFLPLPAEPPLRLLVPHFLGLQYQDVFCQSFVYTDWNHLTLVWNEMYGLHKHESHCWDSGYLFGRLSVLSGRSDCSFEPCQAPELPGLYWSPVYSCLSIAQHPHCTCTGWFQAAGIRTPSEKRMIYPCASIIRVGALRLWHSVPVVSLPETAPQATHFLFREDKPLYSAWILFATTFTQITAIQPSETAEKD